MPREVKLCEQQLALILESVEDPFGPCRTKEFKEAFAAAAYAAYCEAPSEWAYLGFQDGCKISVIKAIRAHTKLGLKEAKHWSEVYPQAFNDEAFAEVLREAGGIVEPVR